MAQAEDVILYTPELFVQIKLTEKMYQERDYVTLLSNGTRTHN